LALGYLLLAKSNRRRFAQINADGILLKIGDSHPSAKNAERVGHPADLEKLTADFRG
jgi:hypothetical protein